MFNCYEDCVIIASRVFCTRNLKSSWKWNEKNPWVIICEFCFGVQEKTEDQGLKFDIVLIKKLFEQHFNKQTQFYWYKTAKKYQKTHVKYQRSERNSPKPKSTKNSLWKTLSSETSRRWRHGSRKNNFCAFDLQYF